MSTQCKEKFNLNKIIMLSKINVMKNTSRPFPMNILNFDSYFVKCLSCRFDPDTKHWSFIAAMTTARSTVGVAVLNGRLYAVGGRDGAACLNSVECYDPHTNKWSIRCPMIKRRGGNNLQEFYILHLKRIWHYSRLLGFSQYWYLHSLAMVEI